jgi:uncharacterized membrane protein YadS
MSRRRGFVPLALAAMLAASLAAVPARADTTGDQATGDPAGDDSLIGAVAAVGCGLSIRALQYTGPNTPVIVIAVSTCLLAFVDGLVSQSG